MAALRLLMIDNYDSFTYNLVQYLGELGAEVDVRRNDAVTLEEVAALRPESILTTEGKRLLGNFLARLRGGQPTRAA